MMNRQVTAIDNAMLQRMVPSVFASEPQHNVSDRYVFVPTIQIVEELQRNGWSVVNARECNVRDKSNRIYAKHVLRLRHGELRPIQGVGDTFPELVLLNSHNRSAAFNMHAGLFRLACSNGLIVADTTFECIRVRHTGDVLQDVIEGTYRIINEVPSISAAVQDMGAVQLTQDERRVFAESALSLITKEEEPSPFHASQLLRPRRYGDDRSDLWTTFNVIQENIIRGGQRGYNAQTRRRTTRREVKSIDKDKKLNQALWALSEKMMELKQQAA